MRGTPDQLSQNLPKRLPPSSHPSAARLRTFPNSGGLIVQLYPTSRSHRNLGPELYQCRFVCLRCSPGEWTQSVSGAGRRRGCHGKNRTWHGGRDRVSAQPHGGSEHLLGFAGRIARPLCVGPGPPVRCRRHSQEDCRRRRAAFRQAHRRHICQYQFNHPFRFAARVTEHEKLQKRKAPEVGSRGSSDLLRSGSTMRGRLYALVRAESTPLASEPMLLPRAR